MKSIIKLFSIIAVLTAFLMASCNKDDNSPKPVADFDQTFYYSTLQDTFYMGNDTVFFNNLSTNADTYLWTFSDNTTSTERNPKKNFIYTGSSEFTDFTITLTATKNGKSSTKTKTIVGWWD
jgi:hypothetical protein